MSTRQPEFATSVRFPLLLALFVVAGSTVLSYGFPPGAPSRQFLGALALLAAPGAALGCAIVAALSTSRIRSVPWQTFCAAAALALIGQLHRHTGVDPRLDTLHLVTNCAALALFGLATAIMVRQRTTGRALELAFDAGIVLTALVLVLGRWTALRMPLLESFGSNYGASAVLIVASAGAGLSAAGVLLLTRSETSGRGVSVVGHATLPLAVAGVALALWLVASVAGAGAEPGSGACCAIETAARPAFVLGWLAIAFAALQSLRPEPVELPPIEPISGGSRLRLLAAPLAAVLLGTLAIDSAANEPLGTAIAAGMGILGTLVALRLGHLLYATRNHSSEQLALAQSLALIEVSRALSGMRQLDETLGLVTRWAVRLLDGRAAVIELLMPDNETLELHAVYGLPNEMLGLTFPVEGSYTGWVVRNGRPRSTENARLDPLLHAASLPYLGGSPLASVPLRYSDKTLGALSCVSSRPFTAADLDLLGAFADQAAVAIENARLFRQVHHLSITDPLTGLSNRRQLERELTREFAAARRGRRLVACMFDLNRFKAYNDRYGHLAGDEALRRFGAVLRGLTRSMNVAARFGGDEFIVLLTESDTLGATLFIERVRAAFPGPDAEPELADLSVCGGFAPYSPEMRSPEDLIAAADAALYLAKPPESRRAAAGTPAPAASRVS